VRRVAVVRGSGIDSSRSFLPMPRHASSRSILRSCAKQQLQSGPMNATGSRSTARIQLPSG
jgi:hypothetical protein